MSQPSRTETAGVSVVIPTFNGARHLPATLDSVLAQGWPSMEIVIVDDGSTDDTLRLLERYEVEHPGVFHVIRQVNQGPAGARNAGIVAARFAFVALLDHDDQWLPGKIAQQMALLSSDRGLEFCFTGVENRYPGTEEVVVERWTDWDDAPERVLAQLLIRNRICTSSVLTTRRALTTAGLFDPHLRVAQDYDLWLRIASRGYRMAYIPEPLTAYVRHESNTSYDVRTTGANTERALQKLFANPGLPPEIWKRRRWYRAHRYLNNASIYLERGHYPPALLALLRAFLQRPASARLGWVRLLAVALWGSMMQATRRHKPSR